MSLKSLTYFQHKDSPKYWAFEDFRFNKINLIAGRNAIGKTRTVNIINSLSKVLNKSNHGIGNGNWTAQFIFDGLVFDYELSLERGIVTNEELKVDGAVQLRRDDSGTGHIRYEETGNDLRFKIETSEVAAFSKRDPLQHPFIEPLINWATTLRFFPFSTNLGQNLFIAYADSQPITLDVDGKDFNRASETFQAGVTKFGPRFAQSVTEDLNSARFNINEIGLGEIEGHKVIVDSLGIGSSPISAQAFTPSGIFIVEKDGVKVFQGEISQGMFRAISLLIQLNYAIFNNSASCVVIDDIGEGLDFERASALIKLLVSKSQQSNIQLIMTTNDSFVMNSIPLEYWIVIERENSKVIQYTYENSRSAFEDFELSGLNNFDFFTSRSYKKNSKKTE
jgi:hypothetical protein